MKTLSFAKTSSFFKPIKSFVPFKGHYVTVIMIVQLSKDIRLIGVCVETESARAIRAQTAPVGWLIPLAKVRLNLNVSLMVWLMPASISPISLKFSQMIKVVKLFKNQK